jgi:hypothetical protein
MEADEHARVAVGLAAEVDIVERVLELDGHGGGGLEGHGDSFFRWRA